MLIVFRPSPSTLLIVSHVCLQSTIFLKFITEVFFSCCPHKASIHCIIFFKSRFSFLTGFPQLFIKQFGFTFSQYYQCFRHPGVKRSIFIGRIYIFFREWTFETVIIKTILAQKHNYLKCTCIASASIVSYGVCALKTENIFAMCDIFMKDCFQSPWI